MGGFTIPRREPRYACDLDVRFLVARSVGSRVSIIESDGHIVERSQQGLRVQSDRPIMAGDTVLVNVPGDTDSPSTLYSPYRIVWHRTHSSACTFGCRLTPASDPLETIASGIFRAPLRSGEAAKILHTLRHDVFDHMASLSMALNFLRLEYAVHNKDSEYLLSAEKAMDMAEESVKKFVAFVSGLTGP